MRSGLVASVWCGTSERPRFSSHYLTKQYLVVTQYIIGGLLASSFVQGSLNSKWVGVFGVLVLVASLFKQQYHPEGNAEIARVKAVQLKSLLRSSQDQLAILEAKTSAGENQSEAMIALLVRVTQTLGQIENAEVQTAPQK